MKFATLIIFTFLFASLTGCGETEAEKQAKKAEAFQKAMLGQMAASRAERAEAAKKSEQKK